MKLNLPHATSPPHSFCVVHCELQMYGRIKAGVHNGGLLNVCHAGGAGPDGKQANMFIFICNNVILLRKYLSADTVDMNLCVRQMYICQPRAAVICN